MDNIEFDFHIAEEQEMEIQEICLRLEKLIYQEYDDSIMDIRQAWEGSESNHFYHKMQQQREKMLHTSTTLNAAKEALREAKSKAEITEEKAKETAENRIY